LTLGIDELVIVDTDRGRSERLAQDLCGRFGTGRARAADDTAAAVRAPPGIVHTPPPALAQYPRPPPPPPPPPAHPRLPPHPPRPSRGGGPRPVPRAAAPGAAAAWRCSRPPTRSACSAGSSPIPSA